MTDWTPDRLREWAECVDARGIHCVDENIEAAAIARLAAGLMKENARLRGALEAALVAMGRAGANTDVRTIIEALDPKAARALDGEDA